MAKRMEVLEGDIASDLVVDNDRADRIRFQFAANHRRGNTAFFQVGEKIDIQEYPVGQNDQGFNAAVQQHLEIALKASALVVDVGEDRQK